MNTETINEDQSMRQEGQTIPDDSYIVGGMQWQDLKHKLVDPTFDKKTFLK